MDRREFLGLSSAAALALLYPGANSAALAGLTSSARGMLVVADERYSDSMIFARALANRGATVFPLNPGLAGVWFDELQPRLTARSFTLAGLTHESDLFALERLAEGCSARPCYVGWHDWRGRPGSQHILRGSIALDQVAQALAAGGDLWAATTADVLMSAPSGQGWQERTIALDLGPAADSPRFLASWMMTPSSQSTLTS